TEQPGTWETCDGRPRRSVARNRRREDITALGPAQESEGFVVATKPGNAGRAKEPCRRVVAVNEGRAAWVLHPTTEFNASFRDRHWLLVQADAVNIRACPAMSVFGKAGCGSSARPV
ncbi:MAG: hypothetical protein K2X00_20905, partial [Nitrospiraceae bacterium]|nr:hypothetical protein [Nitrospiraceae bacterium]